MKVSDIYPQTQYLKATDLTRPVKVKIEEATVKTFTDMKTQEPQQKIVLRFMGKVKVFPLNKTQARAVASAVGSEDIAHWPGKEIVLSSAMAHNGQPTINVGAVVKDDDHENGPAL